ncbi:protein takeout [Cephus cinctus]|uniref:Protein takeout n=1 Tax=Cephus cinctus TaxID=211228 RepID=A0AAJ7C0C4_CEPCN|nr:protein takeout [Cephus cinctus]
MYRILSLSSFLMVLAIAGSVQLPSEFKTCSRSAGNVNQCLADAIQGGIAILTKGSRSLGVLPIDPLLVTEMHINQGSGPVSIKLNFKDLLIHGVSNAKINSVTFDVNNKLCKLILHASVYSPINLVAQYSIDGKVLVLPISGHGNCNISLANPEAKVELTGKEVTKDGVSYVIFTGLNFDLNPQRVEMHFDNLFNGDKTLGDNMNRFLNENWKEVYSELKSPIEKAFGITILEVTNRIFSKVPAETIFPA